MLYLFFSVTYLFCNWKLVPFKYMELIICKLYPNKVDLNLLKPKKQNKIKNLVILF